MRFPVQICGCAAAAVVLAMSPAQAAPMYLSCRADVGTKTRDWLIQIDAGQAWPLGGAYERIRKSSSRVQFIESRVTENSIDIWVRDGNSGEQFAISRAMGVLQFERSVGLDHSGSERVVEEGGGRCTQQPLKS